MSQITAPAIPPAYGPHYRLRNGRTVVVHRKHKEGFLIGEYRPPLAGTHYTCQPDGWYAPESGVRKRKALHRANVSP